MLLVIIYIIFLTLKQVQTTCSINPMCYIGCKNLNCQYDPSTNSFYNRSLATTQINGPLCCQLCSDGYFLYPDQRTCARECSIFNNNQTYADPDTFNCGYQCNSLYYQYVNVSFGYCVQKCPQSNPRVFANPENMKCVQTCTGSCSYHYQLITNGTSTIYTCQSICPNGTNTLTKTDNRSITLWCDRCPLDYYKVNQTMSCVRYCPNGTFANNITRICVRQCIGFSYYNIVNKTAFNCTNLCDNYFYTLLNKTYCDLSCKEGLYGDTSTGECSVVCPTKEGSRYYGNTLTNICVNNCSSLGLFLHPLLYLCYQQCPYVQSTQEQSYYDFLTKDCVFQCPLQMYKYPQNNTCVISCIQPYPDYDKINMQCYSQTLLQQTTKQQISQTTILIVSICVSGGVALTLGVVGYFSYKLLLKKYFIRKQWQFDGSNDIIFST